jgi:hypothetical protein
MNRIKKTIGRWVLTIMGGTVLLGAFSSIGCTVHTNGMTLPSPQWVNQRVQYFPSGPQYPLSKEASMMKEMKAENNNM